MLKNYFKIAIAVLRRRKFFTFISLFGISFTLTILIVLTAFIDHLFSSNYPDKNKERTLYVSLVHQENPKKGWSMSNPPSYYLLSNYVQKLKTPQIVGIGSLFSPSNTYLNNRKLTLNIKYTNAEFWQSLNFNYLEGRPYNLQQVNNAEKLAVISEETRDKYFGKGVKALNRVIETDNVQYRVAGVVQNVAITKLYAYGDIYLPYTLSKSDYNNKSLGGNYIGILVAKSEADVPAMKAEFDAMAAKLPVLEDGYTKISTHADSYLASFTRNLFGDENDSGVGKFYQVLGIFIFIFMLLPTLNLININISRIIERSSEIGVRKAFGASSSTLVYQFIIENIILTVIGGVIGILLALVVLQQLNHWSLINNANLQINFQVLGYAFLLCLFFGLFSGVYPAWRMSRLHVVNALKAA